MNIKEQTLRFLDQMPEVNTVTTYGSGYFDQADGSNEIKSMDLIISVDNPNSWHKENYQNNPEMYKGANIRQLTSYDSSSFFKSIGCFFTTFEGREYKCLVIDKRLLYQDLDDWHHFSLAGRFQKETVTLIDNSGGKLEKLMKKNYQNAAQTALLMVTEDAVNLQEILETIVKLSYLGDIRMICHLENKDKIPNIVNGSHEFLSETYCEFLRYNDGQIINTHDVESITELQNCLQNYLLNTLTPKDLQNKEKVAKAIHKYFRQVDFTNSILLALRCNQTVGIKKSAQTLVGKAKKGIVTPIKQKVQKVKKISYSK